MEWLKGFFVWPERRFVDGLARLIAYHTDIARGDEVMTRGQVVDVLLNTADRLNELTRIAAAQKRAEKKAKDRPVNDHG